MKKFIFLFQSILVVTLLCFTACSNEEVVPQEVEVKLEPQEFLNITYKGNVTAGHLVPADFQLFII